MKSLILAIMVSLAVAPARAQFFKKLKDEAAQRMKDKLAMKKDQKIDEQTEKASNKIMSVPDTVVQKTGRALKKKKGDKKEEGPAPGSAPGAGAPAAGDSTGAIPVTPGSAPAADTTVHTNEE